MNIWNIPTGKLEEFGALKTATEIYGQPGLWRKVYDKVIAEKPMIRSFLGKAEKQGCARIILTGAGSSAFIGISLQGAFLRNLKHITSAIATTDLVTHPCDFLEKETPVLLISFARSGNSPESVAAVKVVDNYCRSVFHLIITCDVSGALARFETRSEKYVFVLPETANDQSLAMTGSYSGMLLAGLLIARLNDIEKLEGQITLLQQYAGKLLNQYSEDFKKLAEIDFQRAVFLGSGPLYGTAIESQLKLQELTDGKVICKNDSFLGFRHGPKAVIDEKTLIFFLISNQDYVWQYERDLMDSMINGHKPLCQIGLIESGKDTKLDKLFILSDGESRLEEDFLPVISVLPAQMLGFFKSLQLGLSPDLPSKSGAISRVVKGVIIYPFKEQVR